MHLYGSQENQWTFIHAMRSARSGVSLMPYHGCLYAIGGFNGFSRLNTAEKYDPSKPGEWTNIAEMASPRSNFASVIVDDAIYVLGGFNGKDLLNSVLYQNFYFCNKYLEIRANLNSLSLQVPRLFPTSNATILKTPNGSKCRT